MADTKNSPEIIQLKNEIAELRAAINRPGLFSRLLSPISFLPGIRPSTPCPLNSPDPSLSAIPPMIGLTLAHKKSRMDVDKKELAKRTQQPNFKNSPRK